MKHYLELRSDGELEVNGEVVTRDPELWAVLSRRLDGLKCDITPARYRAEVESRCHLADSQRFAFVSCLTFWARGGERFLVLNHGGFRLPGGRRAGPGDVHAALRRWAGLK